MCGGALEDLAAEHEAELIIAAQKSSEEIVERAGMQKIRDRGWKSMTAV